MTRTQSQGDFWTFSLHVYGQDGIADACLRLQDRFAADVNLVLFAAWQGARGRRLDADEVQRAVDAVAPWQREVIVVLRELRRRLKSGPPPAPSSQTDTLREAIKANELSAERIEQHILERLVADGLVEGWAEEPATAAIANIVLVLRVNLPTLSSSEVAEPVRAIVAAAVPGAEAAELTAALARTL